MTLLRKRPALVLLPLALVFLVSGLVEAWRDSPTVDEAVDIASGVTALVRHDLRLQPEHGPLPRVLAALPALAGHPVVPEGSAYASGDWFEHTDEFVRANTSAGRLHRVVFLARLVPLLEGLGVAGLLYVLAARLFGPWEGVVAGGLWLSTPVFVGFSHLAAIDVAFTLTTLVVSFSLLRYLDAPSDGRAVQVGLAVGGALLTRHVGLVLVPVAIGVVVVADWKERRSTLFRRIALTAITAWAAVWIAIRVVAWSAPSGASGARLDSFVRAARGDSLLARIVLAVPWPKEWAAGFGYLVLTSNDAAAYLFGHAWNGGQWWYFLAATPIKVPLIAVLALLIGPLGWRHLDRAAVRRAALVVVVPAVALYVTVAAQPLDLGLRYAFPVLALWFVAAGPVVRVGPASARRLGLGVLAGTQAAALFVAYPHSLAWTAPPWQPGYRWATDSNIDWGQDNGRVDDWAAGRHPLVDLQLPRGVDPPDGSAPLVALAPESVHGWVAVSAARLMTVDRDALSWLRAYCPVDTIGGSILLYNFDAPVDARPGPDMPVDLCDGEVSIRRA